MNIAKSLKFSAQIQTSTSRSDQSDDQSDNHTHGLARAPQHYEPRDTVRRYMTCEFVPISAHRIFDGRFRQFEFDSVRVATVDSFWKVPIQSNLRSDRV